MNNFVDRVYCLETRIPKSTTEYFTTFIPKYAALCRRIWQDLKHDVVTDSKYVTILCHKYGFMKRTVNSALRQMKGRANALRELNKVQLQEKTIKIDTLESKIAQIKEEINKLKVKVIKSPNDKDLLRKYKNKKKKLYSWQQRKLRFTNSLKNYETDEKLRYSLCFGGKSFFRKQYNLVANNYKTHQKWLNDFRKLRDRQLYFVGSSEETAGNQMCQLEYLPETNNFVLKIRKEYNYCSSKNRNDKDNYIWLNVNFKYKRDLLINALEDGLPLSYTITRKDKKWYIDVSVTQFCEIITDATKGCVGLDYNNEFIALTETDKYGNIVKVDNIPLYNHGTGNKAKSELSEKISKIVRYTVSVGKALSVENLKFAKTKAQQIKKGKRSYNKMLHLLDYGRYKQFCRDYCANYGVMLKMVNPFNTSKIGKQKYASNRKLSIHNAAAYVIARRGQGFDDSYIKKII